MKGSTPYADPLRERIDGLAVEFISYESSLLHAGQRPALLHVAVTAHATALWTAQQTPPGLPEDEAPRDLLHDRDRVLLASRQRVA